MLSLHSKEMLMGGGDYKYLKVSADGDGTSSCIAGNQYGVYTGDLINITTKKITGDNANYCQKWYWSNRAFSQNTYSGNAWIEYNSDSFYLANKNVVLGAGWKLNNPIEAYGVVVTGGNGIGTAYAENAKITMNMLCVDIDDNGYISSNTIHTGNDGVQRKIEIIFKSPKIIKRVDIFSSVNTWGSLFFGAGIYLKTKGGSLKYEDIPGQELIREEQE